MTAPAPQSQQRAETLRQKPVGYAGVMPGTSGFTMACFQARDIPVGTALYTAPPDSGDVRAAAVEALTTSERLHRYHNNLPEADLCTKAILALSQSPATDAAGGQS